MSHLYYNEWEHTRSTISTGFEPGWFHTNTASLWARRTMQLSWFSSRRFSFTQVTNLDLILKKRHGQKHRSRRTRIKMEKALESNAESRRVEQRDILNCSLAHFQNKGADGKMSWPCDDHGCDLDYNFSLNICLFEWHLCRVQRYLPH